MAWRRRRQGKTVLPIDLRHTDTHTHILFLHLVYHGSSAV